MAKGITAKLVEQLNNGTISRRVFLERAAATGLGAAGAVFLANASVIAKAGGSKNGFAVYQGADGTPSASPSAGAPGRPAGGMEGKTRGEGGELKLLQWQAATMASAHQAVGTKDFLAAGLVQEPLLCFLPDGTIIPNLVAEAPSVENGLLAEDLSSVTFKLLEGVTWSDGTPFTAADVVFTWEWVTNSDNQAVSIQTWSVISSIEAVDDLTAQVTFATPSATWFEPFTGGVNGMIMPKHVYDADTEGFNTSFLTKPIGTGPYKIDSFSPNDSVAYSMNENYREANKPFFATVTLKGGGDAASAARAVIETGDYHHAWNLQVEPDVLTAMESDDSPGKLFVEQGTSVERIHINFSDPNQEVDGQRSEMNTPHPFWSDLAVRQAVNMSVPREQIATNFYFGELGEPPTANILTGLPSFDSPNTSWTFDVEGAKTILEGAGWVLDGDFRAKDGVQLEVLYGTSINQVRQKTQAVVKQAWEAIGIKVNLDQVEAGTFFDSAAGNDRNIGHNYWDISMYTNNPTSPVPTSFMLSWYSGPNRENVAQASNGWSGQNYQRWTNADFDALYESLEKETDIEAAQQTLIAMNDLLISEVVVIPEVNRAADKYAHARTLNQENVAIGVGFELNYWNIQNWVTVS